MTSSPRRGRPRKTETPADLAARARRAAAELLGEQGYTATRMVDVARRIGVTPAALYHHYASKEALLVALVEETLSGEYAELQALPISDAPTTLLRLLERQLQRGAARHTALREALRYLPPTAQAQVADFFIQHLYRFVHDTLQRGVQEGTLRSHHTEMAAWSFLSLVGGIGDLPPEVQGAPQATLELFLNGVAPR
ncbi:TetR/AcrR family transcriptional regulator [Deinococcus koreensis]|nr:TetR/AcrR family transcriptional regulator [Deinococcus koreensis]